MPLRVSIPLNKYFIKCDTASWLFKNYILSIGVKGVNVTTNIYNILLSSHASLLNCTKRKVNEYLMKFSDIYICCGNSQKLKIKVTESSRKGNFKMSSKFSK